MVSGRRFEEELALADPPRIGDGDVAETGAAGDEHDATAVRVPYRRRVVRRPHRQAHQRPAVESEQPEVRARIAGVLPRDGDPRAIWRERELTIISRLAHLPHVA